MIRARILSSAFAALTVAFAIACGPGSAEIDGETADDDNGLTAAELASPVITVSDAGNWSQVLGCSGYCISKYSFWVDLKVKNDAYQKTVAIDWSADNWATTKTAYAKYEQPLADGYEQWGVDVELGQGNQPPAADVQYKAYVVMNGVTTFDPHNVHYVYKSVLAQHPVTLVSSKVAWVTGSGAKLSGTARIYDFGATKSVYVRYSTDGWQTWKETKATFISGSSHDYAFTTPALGASTLPDEVQYVIRYHSGTTDYWDSNNGQNYRFTVKPQFTLDQGDAVDTVSGVLTYVGTFRSDLPMKSQRARIDSATYVTGNVLSFSTEKLADGAHTITFEDTLVGGHVEKHSVTIQVKNRAQPLGSWSVPTTNPDGSPWDAATDASGRIYVLGDDYVVRRYDAYATTTAPLSFPAVSSALGVTVDSSDRVYVLAPFGAEPGIHRFTSTGAIDATYGQQGVMDVSGSYAGQTICYPGYFAALGNELLLADTCNSRVLRFNAQGAFIDQLVLDPQDGITAGLHVAGNTAWIGQAHRLTAVQVKTGMLQETAHVTVPANSVNTVQGLWRNPATGAFWILDSTNRWVVLDAQGAVQTIWDGGNVSTFKGGFPLGRAVVGLADGNVAVLSTDAKRFEKFSAVLK